MAYKPRKRKVKKNVPMGQAYIHSTFNNTIVTLSDTEGNAISWASAGTLGFKGVIVLPSSALNTKSDIVQPLVPTHILV